ncbi:MAG: ATP-binding protein [Desulfurococcales archaeon ex4484_204]|nr:MAG: ATP-binding protein [Desulfurococcales archaeon ex4484_204]
MGSGAGRPKVGVRLPPAVEERLRAVRERMERIKHKVVVMSGKGGVGKSFIASSLALALASLNYRVGLMDVDFHGPSAPKMLGIRGRRLVATGGGIEPAVGPLGILVMSLDFLLPEDDTPVIWRGPIKSTAITQFVSDVNWGELDYLVIDMPPGTGDEAITVAQQLPQVDGAVFVTIPSEVSLMVVGRTIVFARKVGIRPLGVIENMSEFYCPDTGRTYRIFGRGSGRLIAEKYGIEFLGEIPLDPRIAESNDRGEPFILKYPDSEASKRIFKVTEKLVAIVEGQGGGK